MIAKVSADFPRGHMVFSNRILVQLIDGWFVQYAQASEEMASKIFSAFSRKGCYALNVQCIIENNKRVTWLSYKHKGGYHDSSCLRDTQLYPFLHLTEKQLSDLGYHILGNSAYALECFLLVL